MVFLLPLRSRTICDLQKHQMPYHKPPNHQKQLFLGYLILSHHSLTLVAKISVNKISPTSSHSSSCPSISIKEPSMGIKLYGSEQEKNTVEKRKGKWSRLQKASVQWLPTGDHRALTMERKSLWTHNHLLIHIPSQALGLDTWRDGH